MFHRVCMKEASTWSSPLAVDRCWGQPGGGSQRQWWGGIVPEAEAKPGVEARSGMGSGRGGRWETENRDHRSGNRDGVRKRGSQKAGIECQRSGNRKLGVRMLGPETSDEMGLTPCACSPRDSSSHDKCGIAHQVALRGDTNEDKIIPNTDLFSFRPLLGGWVHRPPAGLTCGGDCQDDGCRETLLQSFPALSLSSLLPQILLLLPPTL